MHRRYRTIASICCVLAVAVVVGSGNRVSVAAPDGGYCFRALNIVDELRIFMQLRSRLRGKITEEQEKITRFSLGEYYFKTKTMHDARRTFQEYVDAYPAGIISLLAEVYLYKIADMRGGNEQQDAIKRAIFKDQFLLLFGTHKTAYLTSLFGNEYEVRYFVDKIEVFLNGDLFERIYP